MSWSPVEKGTLDLILPPPGYQVKEGFYWDHDIGLELPSIKKGVQMTHVDDWISSAGCGDSREERYAKFFFLHKRHAAILQHAWDEWTEQFKLYCDFAGHTWRVTGASRMGDIWLLKDLNYNTGYDIRRYVDECSNWRREP